MKSPTQVPSFVKGLLWIAYFLLCYYLGKHLP